MRRIVLLFCLLISFTLFAQNETTDENILPKGFAPGEEEMMSDYINSINARSLTCINTPPDTESVRSLAEWEELQAVVITWTSYPAILTEIVRHAKEEVEVIIVCSNDAVVKNTLGAAGIDWSTGVSFLEESFNSVWVRDYGPNTVYLNDVESLAFVDWIYNRPRPLDDTVPEAIAEFLGIDNYCTTNVPTDLVHTGGNYMSDGLGTAFSSRLVLDENGPDNNWGTSNHSEEDVEQIMEDFMGITTYPKMVNLPFDAIHHIDMHMKILDEERLIVGEYPEGVADGPQIEANIQYVLNNFTTPYGDPYEIIRIPMPPDNGAYPDTWWADYRTYANAIFLNNTILVPIYEEQYDTTGLRIWEEAMPGYNIIGIDCNDIIPASGALHCITKEVGVDEPLWITHKKVKTACANEETEVTAQIKHKLGISSAIVHYTTDQVNWLTADMTANGDGTFTAMLPILDSGTEVSYYLQGTAPDGKTITRPLPGADGAWSFTVEECSVSADYLEANSTKLETIFPNPASAITCIPVSNQITTKGSIEVTDILGKHIETVFEGMLPSGDSKYFIDAANYTSGTYFISLRTESEIQIQKLIVK